jgi:hypothetical protein
MDSIRLRLTYDGKGPVHWNGGPALFGVQDKTEALDAGAPGPGGTRVFDLVLQVKSLAGATAVLVGDIAHGSPAERFLYLSWRNLEGNYAQRLKLPLNGIASRDVRAALDRQVPLLATLVDHHPRATSTGANIGGSRPISWTLA